MKLHFALRQFYMSYYKNAYRTYAVFPKRGRFESHADWNAVKDCIGFLTTQPKSHPFWVIYKLKKL